MADTTVTTVMKHPNGDVKVVPNELVDQFTERGWEKASKPKTSRSSSTTKKTAAKKTAAKKTAAKAPAPTE